MKTRSLALVAFLCCFLFISKTVAQVTSVNYQIKYDTVLCRYDAFIIINAGSANTLQQRTQFNSQFSIVVPHDDTLQIIESFNPKISGTPSGWSITSTIYAPTVEPGSDFYSIVPSLVNNPRYDTLTSGDTIKIFSFTVKNNTKCGSGIRIFRNGTDPDSDEPGMEGSDFRNGFTIGGPVQKYNNNSVQLNPPKPVLINALTTCNGGIEIDLTATTSACQTPLSYAWSGPNSYVGTSQDVNITPATLANQGDYKVVVTDSLGCKDSLTITATTKPSAGADQTVCAGSAASISGTNPNTGSWAAQAGNPSGATLGPLPSGAATVTFSNAASGTYSFIYSTGACSDTMSIVVNPKPTVSISGASSICTGNTTTLSPNTGGTWVSNNPSIATVDMNTGVVTAVAQGAATFTFTSTATGCSSTTGPVTINPGPTVTITGTSSVCIGSTTTLSPTTGGTWSSSAPSIATVTNTGVVTGVSAGTANMTFTETSTGCVSTPLTVTVTPKPTISITGNDSLCVQGTTTVSPTTGGTWASSNITIATVSNGGIVTGIAPGKVRLTWTQTSTGCQSDPSDTIYVIAKPVVTLSVPVICVGSTTSATPGTGGTWVSNNPSVATITNAGVITGVSQGTVSFTFTNSATLCTSTTANLTVNPRPTVLAAQSTICIGSTTNVTPSSGGTWSSGSTGVATVTNAGVVTGISAGSAVLTFTETSTGCTNTLTITVTARPVVSITGSTDICVGFTSQLSPTTGGTWASSAPSIATVSNSGLVTGISVGSATFTFTATASGCPSLPTSPITVKNKPVVSVSGSSTICVGGTSSLSPNTGGTWASNNPSVATVNPATGIVTGVGPGSATFTFTETGGCVSNATTPITVNSPPIVAFSGPSTICASFTTTVSPTIGGTWISSNTGVATVTNAGLVTGIAAGTAQLTYTQTSTNCPSAPLTVTISPKPTVTLLGDANICIDSTTTLSPTSGGAWASNNNAIATVTNGGLVTGVSQGTAIFTFTSTAGCQSDPITSVAIMPKPTVNITGPADICIGSTTTLSPSTGGTWVSNNPAVATVTNGGIVTGVTEGAVTFTFTSDIGCSSEVTDVITVNPKPITVLNGPNSICVGATTSISPTTGGAWTSSNNAVATVTNTGIITGITPGTAKFVFTNTTTGCVSDSSVVVTITTGPTIDAPLDTDLCIGETTSIAPNPVVVGTWASSNSGVASIIPSTGVITAVAQGTVTFTFTQTSTGCKSIASAPLTVNGRPSVSISGNDNICIGGTTNLTPSTGGTWTSNNTGVATVTDAGVVSGIAAGSTTFVFTLTATGCSSLATSPVTVTAAPIVSITGPTYVCIGGTTTLSPSSGGVWTSSDPSVATVNNLGLVTSVGPGKVTFTFTESATGCASESATDTITIDHCLNPDFNATFVNVSVGGDASTNDNVQPTATYGPTPILISSPVGSLPVISFNSNGTYTFVANLIGVYVYEVPVCTPPQESGCPRSLLTITVTDHLLASNQPVANVDFATTPLNTDVTLATLANDGCVVVLGCDLDEGSVVIIANPDHGTASVDAMTGDITYTPNLGYVGLDTLTYRVCVTGEPANCATAYQIITINSASALNSTIADDDFAVTPQSTPVSGNVSDNDSDPEGDTQSVIPNTIVVPAGELSLLADGSYTFTPSDNFTGPVEFVYTTFDDNVSPDTAQATLHILVVPDLIIKVRVYLEGSLLNGTGTADGRPLMRDNLRVSPFNGTRYIPNKDPYQYAIPTAAAALPFDVTAKFTQKGPGLLTRYDSIPNPTGVFAVTGQNAIVDWVFIELRDKSNNKNVLATRSGLIQRDGDVVDLDGVSGLRFQGVAIDNYYVVVRHARHLGVMSKFAQTPTQLTTLVNFTTAALPVFDYGTSHPTITSQDFTGLAQKDGINLNKIGFYAMWAGDFDASGRVKFDNPNDDLNFLLFDVSYYTTNLTNNANYDFAYGYLQSDYDMNSKSKFDNPDDDKNMLYTQVLLYPLNAQLLSNYANLIEQLPK